MNKLTIVTAYIPHSEMAAYVSENPRVQVIVDGIVYDTAAASFIYDKD